MSLTTNQSETKWSCQENLLEYQVEVNIIISLPHRNYEKMTSLTKTKSKDMTSLTESKSKLTATNHCYDDKTEIIERISARQPVAVASE